MTFDMSAFYDRSKVFLAICFANSACYAAILRKSIAYSVAYHTIFVLFTFQLFEIVSQNRETFTAIEVIGINYSKRFFYNIFSHKYCMVGSPWLYTFGI